MDHEPSPSPRESFGGTAIGLAGSPLGIIALFLVLVYGLASLVMTFTPGLTAAERWPMILFLVSFPVLVLGVFFWLVARHSEKLYGPRDFKDEQNWVRVKLETVASLVAAKHGTVELDREQIREIVQDVVRLQPGKRAEFLRGDSADWRRRILWVDDHPEGNRHLRHAFELQGCSVTSAMNTDDALTALDGRRFAVIISDMCRKEGPREGMGLLEEVRRRGLSTPFFVFSSSKSIEAVRQAVERLGIVAIERSEKLFARVMDEIR
ncbi:response regulator [Actinomycetes bacterium KLBMP 9759]